MVMGVRRECIQLGESPTARKDWTAWLLNKSVRGPQRAPSTDDHLPTLRSHRKAHPARAHPGATHNRFPSFPRIIFRLHTDGLDA